MPRYDENVIKAQTTKRDYRQDSYVGVITDRGQFLSSFTEEWSINGEAYVSYAFDTYVSAMLISREEPGESEKINSLYRYRKIMYDNEKENDFCKKRCGLMIYDFFIELVKDNINFVPLFLEIFQSRTDFLIQAMDHDLVEHIPGVITSSKPDTFLSYREYIDNGFTIYQVPRLAYDKSTKILKLGSNTLI